MTSCQVRTKRLLLSGQLVESWEHPDVAFGWAPEDLRRYVDREEWVLLFNAVMLTAPDVEPARAS